MARSWSAPANSSATPGIKKPRRTPIYSDAGSRD